MFLRSFLPVSASLALLFVAGCRDEKIATYRVPKETPPVIAPADSPASMAALPADSTSPAADPGPLTWQAPAAWTAKPLGPMRKGSFLVLGTDGAEADFSIVSFPGDAGGLAQNLNRWRGQLKLAALSPDELSAAATPLAVGNLQFTVIDFAGQGATGPTRILGAVLTLPDQSYFFKLMGPDATVESARAAFLDFLKTVKTR